MALTVLPRLDDPHPLARGTIDAFRRDGHVCVRALASADEVSAYRPLIDAATMAHRYDKRPLDERDTYGKAFVQSPNLWRRESPIAGFTLAQRFARVAAELMGVDGVRLYHDQALYKEPGGGFTPWHQDQTYWPLDTTHTITMWMPLLDIPPNVGSMRFASGSHAFGNLGFEGIGDDSQDYFETLIAQRGFTVNTHGADARRRRDIPCRLDDSRRRRQSVRCNAQRDDDHLLRRRRARGAPDRFPARRSEVLARGPASG